MEKIPARSESVESNEYIPSTEVMCRFLNATPEVLEAFKGRLRDAQGHLRIWVHPLYTEQQPTSASSRLGDANLSDVQEKLRVAFLRTAESVVKNQSSSPLIVYEVTKEIEATKSLLADHVGCASSELESLGILFVPTERSSSSLDMHQLDIALQSGTPTDVSKAEKLQIYKAALNRFFDVRAQYDINEENGWEALKQPIKDVEEAKKFIFKDDYFMVSVYKELGLGSALVSGAYLEVYQALYKKVPEKPKFVACAGAVVSTLRAAGFPTDISNNIWPPKELIKEAGLEVKQTGSANNSAPDLGD